MYQEFYRLQRDPFRLAPDPGFSFRHRSYEAAYQHLHEALDQEECFAMVAARPGTGKTTLTEEFVASLDRQRIEVAKLVTTQVDPTELLRLIAFAFGLDAETLDRASTLHRLERYLRDVRHAGRRALLIVDEAQGLGVEALEQLRLLSNLQHQERALLQIFLVGQEQLHSLLTDRRLEQLQQRIVAACRLQSLQLEETRDYVQHRLCVAGWNGDPALDAGALILVQRFSQGLPRYINRLCNRLLLHGALEQKHRLGANDMALVLLDLSEELLTPVHDQPGPEGSSNRELLYAVAAGGPWQHMLSPLELQFLQQPSIAPPPELPPAAEIPPMPSALGASAPPAPARRTWLRWSIAAAALLIVGLPLLAFYGGPVQALASSVGWLQPKEPPPVHRLPAQSPRIQQQRITTSNSQTRTHPSASAAMAGTDFSISAAAGQAAAPTPVSSAPGAANETASPRPSSELDEETAPAETVTALLARAQAAIEEDRLTVPKDDSAYALLLKARQLDPKHPGIAAGLDRIAQRYATLARWWMNQGDYGQAHRLMSRGLEIRPHDPSLHALRQEMHAAALRARQPSPFPSAFEDSSASEAVAESEAARHPVPALFSRLKALLRGEADNDEP